MAGEGDGCNGRSGVTLDTSKGKRWTEMDRVPREDDQEWHTRLRSGTDGLRLCLPRCLGWRRPLRHGAETIRLARDTALPTCSVLIVMRSQHLLDKFGQRQGVPIEDRVVAVHRRRGDERVADRRAAGYRVRRRHPDDRAVGAVRGRTLHRHGIVTLDMMPLYLNTIDPNVHSIRDLHRQGPDRHARRRYLPPGDHADDRGRQGVRPGGAKKLNALRIDVAPRRHGRAGAQGGRHRALHLAAVHLRGAGA